MGERGASLSSLVDSDPFFFLLLYLTEGGLDKKTHEATLTKSPLNTHILSHDLKHDFIRIFMSVNVFLITSNYVSSLIYSG